MSAPTNTRPQGRVSPKKHWRDYFQKFLHSAPDSTLPTTNLPVNPDRNLFALSRVKHLPSMEESCVDAFCSCQASDGQLATNPRNYSATVFQLSQDRISHDTFALIEYVSS